MCRLVPPEGERNQRPCSSANHHNGNGGFLAASHAALHRDDPQRGFGSKHGVRFLLKQNRLLPETVAAPTCHTCHMQEGDHEVRTAWGFLGVRLPMPEDTQWAADRATISQALGVLDPEGDPTARLELVKQADVARLTQEDWQRERDKLLRTCN